jgi:hypothetical protein
MNNFFFISSNKLSSIKKIKNENEKYITFYQFLEGKKFKVRKKGNNSVNGNL